MSESVGDKARKLPVIRILLGAFVLPWAHRWAFGRALAVPAGMWIAFHTGWYFTADGMSVGASWAISLLSLVIFVIFTVLCHRLVLLGWRIDAPLVPGWSWRETRFLLWVVAIYVVFVLCFVLVQLTVPSYVGVRPGPSDAVETREGVGWVMYVAGILATYVVARISFVLPASAIDHKPNLLRVWRLSRGNGWRLVIIVGGLPWAISGLINLAHRDGASFAEWLFLAVAGIVLLVVEIAALSLSYRYLAQGVETDELVR